MMNHRIFLTGLLLCLLSMAGRAQAPKWAEKARRAVLFVATYDADGKLLHTGNGFFVTEQGVALSDFSLFEGAARAEVVTADGQKMPVATILGADGMYDVVKFQVSLTGKKTQALTLAATAPAEGATAYLLPYSTQKVTPQAGKVSGMDKVSEQYGYYTLELPLKAKMVSCPLLTETGEVFGLAQQSSGADTASISYAIDARYAFDRTITPLAYNDRALNSIGIKKALPDTAEQALVYLYMASTQLPAEEYAVLLDDFIAQYPDNSDGYLRRATARAYADAPDVAAVQADLDKALSLAAQKETVYYERAKLQYSYLLTHPDATLWSWDTALEEVDKAIQLTAQPIYVQLKGDIAFAKADYATALSSYEEVNHSELASPASLFSIVRTKQLMDAPQEEYMALMDSCVAQFTKPYTSDAAPYLHERAQMRMDAGQARLAMVDYDAFYDAMKGEVGDLFYYRRGQAALVGKQFQRALDDMSKAIELRPSELTYRAELALVNLRIGRNDEAVKILQEALRMDANYAEGYRLLGIAYLQLKQPSEACQQFAKAKSLGDTAVDALIEKHCK